MGGFGMMDSTSLPFCFTSSSLVGVGGLCVQASFLVVFWVVVWGLFGRSSVCGRAFSILLVAVWRLIVADFMLLVDDS